MTVTVPFRRSSARHSLTGFAVVLSLCACSPSPPADSPAAPPKVADTQLWWRNAETVSSLSLSDEQLAALDAAFAERSRQAGEIRRSERQTYVQLLRALRTAGENPEGVEEAREALESLAIQRHRLQVSRLVTAREVLTLEQWEQLRQTVPDALSLGAFRPFATARREITADFPAGEENDETEEIASGPQP